MFAIVRQSRFIASLVVRQQYARQLSNAVQGVKNVIDDFSDDERQQYSPEEIRVRCKLASLYRLVDRRGWSMGIYNHITAHLPHQSNAYLLNVFGTRYDEVTASSLVTVDGDGNMLNAGSWSSSSSTGSVGVNRAGYVLHSAVHQYRPDLVCAIHVHVPEVVAVSCMRCGLLPLSQEAIIVEQFGGVSYHDYQGVLINETEKKDIQNNLGPKNKVLFLCNHGVVVCGESVEETYLLLDTLVLACCSQVAALSAGRENLVLPDKSAIDRIAQMKADRTHIDTEAARRHQPFDFGQQDFEAWMRRLDSEGLRTGYDYRRPELLTIGHRRQ